QAEQRLAKHDGELVLVALDEYVGPCPRILPPVEGPLLLRPVVPPGDVLVAPAGPGPANLLGEVDPDQRRDEAREPGGPGPHTFEAQKVDRRHCGPRSALLRSPVVGPVPSGRPPGQRLQEVTDVASYLREA